jgi:hypothetical protein
MARRSSGSVGRGGGAFGGRFFPPPGGLEPQVLEISASDTGHERVSVETSPGSALEVVEAELLLELLVRLLAYPSLARQEQPQPNRHGHLAPCQGQRQAIDSWPACAMPRSIVPPPRLRPCLSWAAPCRRSRGAHLLRVLRPMTSTTGAGHASSSPPMSSDRDTAHTPLNPRSVHNHSVQVPK